MKIRSSVSFFAFLVLFGIRITIAQERLGLISENYSGIGNAFINPANTAHTPFQLDLNLATADLFFNNRILNIDLPGPNDFSEPKFSLAPFRYGSFEAKLMYKLPSLAVRLENFTIGAYSNFRMHAGAKNFPNELARKFRNNFEPAFANEIYTMKQHELSALLWRETGINFSRVGQYYENERLYAGINLKALHAATGFYLGSDNAYDVQILDSIHYHIQQYAGQLGNGTKGWGIAADLGVKFVRYQKGEWFSKARNENEKLFTNYIFSAGISLTDFGWVKFKDASSTSFLISDLDVELDTSVLNNQGGYADPISLIIASMGNMVDEIDANQSTVQQFSMQLPTALSFQADYHPFKYFYVNATGKIGLPLFYGARVSAAGMFSITPRLEHKKVMLAMPLSLYRWREPTIGLAARYRGFTVGSDVIYTGNRTQGFDHFNFYFSFKISIEEMEHSFLKPPVPPWIRMNPDTVPLPEGGYVNKPSYNPGETGQIYYSKNKMKADTVLITTLSGDTAGKVLAATRPQRMRKYKPWKFGYGYHITTSYKMKNLKSGIYVFDNKVPFIVKPKDQPYDILVVIPTNEFTANNIAGGRSLHQATKNRKPGNIVSLHRPHDVSDYEKLLPLTNFFKSDTSLHVGYISEKDLENSSSIKDAKLIIIAGNSTHWTRKARQNFDKYLDKGGNAMVVSKDFMHWQIRFRQKGTQMICFKKKLFDLVQDPYLKTTTWDDPKLSMPRPPRMEQEKINGAVLGEGTQDSLLTPALQYAIKKIVPVTKANAGTLNIEGSNEKHVLREVLVFGEQQNELTPVYIGKRKTASGRYMQTPNLELLNVSDEKVKSFWYGLIKSTVR